MPGRRSRIIIGGAAIVAAALALPGMGQVRAEGFALVVGISQYEDPTVPQLRFADADAQEIADNLKIYSSFPPECIKLLLNRQATGAAIRAAFVDLDKRCSADGSAGTALVYFAGHAVSDFKKATSGEAREFLVPYDASLDARYKAMDGSENNDTFLKKEEFATRLTNIRESHVAVVLDACHSGMPDFAGIMRYYLNVAKAGNKQIALLAASSIEGTATEFAELRHGALTYEVLQTIKAGRAATPKTERYRLAMTTLYNEVKSRFKTEIVEGHPLSAYHEPQIAIYPPNKPVQVAFADMRGDLAPPLTAAVTPPSPPHQQVANVAPVQLPPEPAAKETSPPAPAPVAAVTAPVAPPRPAAEATSPAPPAPGAVANTTSPVPPAPGPVATVIAPTPPAPGPVANTTSPAAPEPGPVASVTAPALPPPAPPPAAAKIAKVSPPTAPPPKPVANVASRAPAASGKVANVTSPTPAAPAPAAGVTPSAPPAPQFGYVHFAGAIPNDSYVEVDGTSVPNWKRGSPVRVTPGPHILVIGTTTYSYRRVAAVEVPANRTVTLKPVFAGSLTLKSRAKTDPNQAGPPLEFSLDGRPLGQSTTDLALQNITAGTHKLTVRIFDTVQTTDISIRPDSPLTLVYLIQAVAPPTAPKRNVIPF